MSILISETQPKSQIKKKQSIVNWYQNLIIKIIESLKYRSSQSTYIQKLQNNSLNLNGHRTVIEITSLYGALFKINMTLEIIFMIHIQIIVKYIITPLNFSIDQKITIMDNLKYKLNEIEKNAFHKGKIYLQNGIKIQQIIYHQFDVSQTNLYAQITSNFITQSYQICNAMIFDLQQEFISSKPFLGKQKIKQSMVAYQGLQVVEKENTKFRNFYKNQNNGVSFLAKPQNIPDKPHQILRQLDIQVEVNRKKIQSSRQKNPRFYGSYSQLSYLQAFGAIIDTYFNHRQQKQNEKNDPEYKPGAKQVYYRLIQKRAGADEDSRLSMRNQKNYLKQKGGLPNPYICNYFLPLKKTSQKKSKNQQTSTKPQQTQLYSQFHEDRVFEKFHHNQMFTLLDVINFGEQIMTALISFYLDLGYLNRDVKQENILINKEKVIQIIDHGSSFIYKNKVYNPLIERQRLLFDSKLRSTLYCNKNIFIEDSNLQAKYKYYKNYRDLNSVHRTFDVYSVGYMLEQILSIYELFKCPKWMEVCQKLKILTFKMVQRDFQNRVQMEDALQELKQIRKFIYETQNQKQ